MVAMVMVCKSYATGMRRSRSLVHSQREVLFTLLFDCFVMNYFIVYFLIGLYFFILEEEIC